MMFLTALHVVFLVNQLISPIFCQNVQGRHLRPNLQKCDQRNGCSSIDDSSYEPDDKYDAADGYRSIGIGGRPNVNQDFKKDDVGDSRPGRINFEYQLGGKDSDYASVGGSNRQPPRDKPVYIPKPVRDSYPSSLHTKDDGYVPSSVEVSHNPKPVRGTGSFDSKPIANPNSDPYKPKPIGISSSGYNPRPDRYVPKPVDDGYDPPSIEVSHNPKPVRGSGSYDTKPISNPSSDPYKPRPTGIDSSGYNPRPDRYVPKPVDDEYRPKPEASREDGSHRPIPEANRRPKPGTSGAGSRPRPVPHRDYPRPGGSQDVPNTDLGGYNDPKDDDDPKKNGDYTAEDRPTVGVGNCVCVPYYQCRDGHIVTDGAGIIDARKKPQPDEDLPLDGKFRPPSCGPFHVCCNTPETSTVRPYEHKCGVRNPSGINSRLLSPSNKGEADFGEWPWQAAVLKSEGKLNIFQCGGVLIDKFHVLTVAHCVFHLSKYDEYPLKVRLGEWDTQTTTEFLAHEDYRVSKIIVHPDFKNTSLWNDVALLRLEEAVLFAPHIDTICLPKYDEIFIQQNCVVTGWGKDAYKGGTFSNIMKEVALQVIDNYQCEEMLRKTRLGRFFQLHDGFLCAGGEYGLDSCKGDGGGPLVCYRKDKSYALAGIVSWGIDCGQPGVPGVYAKIQKYLDWISKTTGVYLEDYWPKH